MKSLLAVAASFLGLIANEPTHCTECSISDTGLALIRNFEGYSPFVYKDIAGHPTIGFGHLIKPGETFKEPLLPEQAEELLLDDVSDFEVYVNRGVKVPLLQNQFDALTSLTFNVGPGAKGRRSGIITLKSGGPSTVLRRVNSEEHERVPPAMKQWKYADGKVSNGLVRRRSAEAALYAGL